VDIMEHTMLSTLSGILKLHKLTSISSDGLSNKPLNFSNLIVYSLAALSLLSTTS
jgi:hypothetical protein